MLTNVQNGEITDPPVATERVAPRPRTARPQAPSSSSTSSTSKPNFCDTCLKHQRLFTASLAQYFPDDPDHPDLPKLEANYKSFRRRLEQRYPQVCDDCAGRVGLAIEKAGYTAKTDHLRKMMERSREAKVVRRSTGLDFANFLGWALWWGALLLQVAWHLKVVTGNVFQEDYYGIRRAFELLPAEDDLMQESIICTLLSIWWNPQLVQVVRGFTKHILGLKEWYSFQVVIFLSRIVIHFMVDLTGQREPAQLSAHLGIGGLTCLVYMLAKKSIKFDTTPLFASHNRILSPAQQTVPAMRQGGKSFAELLNDALDEPSTTPPKEQCQQRQRHTSPPSTNNGFISHRSTPYKAHTNPSQPSQQVNYSDEMDWTPTGPAQSTHRAFRQQKPPRRFGEAPIQEHSGPFWYKVPPAPLNPAHRLRNPPVQPALRSKPEPTGESIFFRGGKNTETKLRNQDRGVVFKERRFFAEETRKSDESLAEMLGQKFTLSSIDSPKKAAKSKAMERGGVARRRLISGAVALSGLLSIGAAVKMWLGWRSGQQSIEL